MPLDLMVIPYAQQDLNCSSNECGSSQSVPRFDMHVSKLEVSISKIACTGPHLHTMLMIFDTVEHTYIPDLVVCLLVMEDRWSSRN